MVFFFECKSLYFITINAKSIGSSVFYGCTYLTDVVIGNNMKSIDNADGYLFENCSRLTSVRFENTESWY